MKHVKPYFLSMFSYLICEKKRIVPPAKLPVNKRNTILAAH